MSGYVWRDPSRMVGKAQAQVRQLRPLPAEQWASLTLSERALRGVLWQQMVEVLRLDHERRYYAPKRRAELLADYLDKAS